MARIQAALRAVADKLISDKALLKRAQRRYKANRKRAFQHHNQGIQAQRHADAQRGQGKATEALDSKAARLHHKAKKNHDRAQFWLGRIKVLTQRVEKLEASQAALEAERKKFNKVTISGNQASGGTKPERLKAVALASAAACSSGRRHNFYSQAGSWDVSHCISGESYGERSDCSSWFTSVYHSCGLSDPNGQQYTAGYTGTLVANGRQVDRSDLHPGDAVIYGSGTGHHVEMYVGPGDRTIGHGSAPVDVGTINLFGDGQYRFFSYR